jgi:hypothetical protein
MTKAPRRTSPIRSCEVCTEIQAGVTILRGSSALGLRCRRRARAEMGLPEHICCCRTSKGSETHEQRALAARHVVLVHGAVEKRTEETRAEATKSVSLGISRATYVRGGSQDRIFDFDELERLLPGFERQRERRIDLPGWRTNLNSVASRRWIASV